MTPLTADDPSVHRPRSTPRSPPSRRHDRPDGGARRGAADPSQRGPGTARGHRGPGGQRPLPGGARAGRGEPVLAAPHPRGEALPGRAGPSDGTERADRVDPFPYEAASCQLFTALPAQDRATPTLYANDPEQRLLVLEDLGRCSTLADKLDGDDPKAAERALLGATRALGSLQAATAAREGDFGALLRRSGVRHWRDPLADDARSALAEIPDLLAHLLRVEAAPAAVAHARSAASPARRHPLPRLQPLGGLAGELPAHRGGRPLPRLRVGLLPRRGADRRVGPAAVPGLGRPAVLPSGMAEAMTASWQSEVAGRVARARRPRRSPGRATSPRRRCGCGCAPARCCRGSWAGAADPSRSSSGARRLTPPRCWRATGAACVPTPSGSARRPRSVSPTPSSRPSSPTAGDEALPLFPAFAGARGAVVRA